MRKTPESIIHQVELTSADLNALINKWAGEIQHQNKLREAEAVNYNKEKTQELSYKIGVVTESQERMHRLKRNTGDDRIKVYLIFKEDKYYAN